jgi:hypothetical protein
LTYVNDMSISIDGDCKLIVYADDSAILYTHKDPNIISSKLGNVCFLALKERSDKLKLLCEMF